MFVDENKVKDNAQKGCLKSMARRVFTSNHDHSSLMRAQYQFIIVLGLLGFSSLSLSNPSLVPQKMDTSFTRLKEAIHNPEYVLTHWIALPTAPKDAKKITLKLSLKDAILLALRYNPNIQNAELDRIIQRYQLRLAYNEFEVQYALAGSGTVEKNKYAGIGQDSTKTAMASPEFTYKSPLGTQSSLSLDNNVGNYNSYSPVVRLSMTQPLLRGFGQAVNEAHLKDAEDNEKLNQVLLKQAIINQITTVIGAYRNLVLSGHNLENQKRQLLEAQKSYEINEKRIQAGQLEPTGNIQQSYQIESLSLMVLQAENDFKVAAFELLQSIGLDPETALSVPSDLPFEPKPLPSEKEAINIAFSHNNEYLSHVFRVRADERAITVAKNQQKWQLDLTGNIQTGMVNNVDQNSGGVNNIYNGRNINESANLTLTIPIHDLNRREQLISAKIRLEKDRLNLLAAGRALKTQIKNLFNSIENLKQRYTLAQKQVELAQSSYTLEKKKQEAGIATALDVNNTQNQLLQAQIGLMSAKIAYLNQCSALERLLGTTLEAWQIKLRFGE